MKKNILIQRIFLCGLIFILYFVGITGNSLPVYAAEITIDGDPSEWTNAIMYGSTDSNIEKWTVAKDDEYLYFYAKQIGGNAWWMSITNTYMELEYDNIGKNQASQIRFVLDGNSQIAFKNAYYSDITGTKSAYVISDEANKYEVEFAIPLDYFAEEDFVLHYCGTAVESNDIVDISTIEEVETVAPVYEGITVDGNFSDWKAVEKTEVNREAMISTAMVFDGDWLYIYMKESFDGAITWSGEFSNGKFTIYTDTGRNTTFKLNTDSLEGIEGGKVAHANNQYEIAIPASAIKQYKETISFGYYMEQNMLIENVANLKGNPGTDSDGDGVADDTDREFSGIVYDGQYSDWDYYPHDLIQYSTSGGVGGDAEAALYVDNTTLYGHVLSLLHMNEKEFQPFYIRINEDSNMSMQMQIVVIDSEGNIDYDAPIDNLEAGTYEFALRDSSSGNIVGNINDEGSDIYGKMYITVRKDGDGLSISDEVEYKVDLEKLAEHYNIDTNDMRILQANYVNIGTEWVTIAGTSTGAILGIGLCIVTVAGVAIYKRRKKHFIV